ncbi:MAG TPA: ATP-binding protein [Vicinamibacterales bacterium]|nr:ATP-binding protein [Vicinamibacterales bacterium]
MLIRSDHQSHSLIEELRRENERQRRAIEAGGLGIWEWDIFEDRVTWSDGIYALHGLSKGEFGGRVADFAALVHPDDLADVQRSLDTSLASGDVYTAEFRICRPDGSIRWMATRAEVVRAEDGRARRVVGTSFDVTDRVTALAAERESRAAAERARKHLELLVSAGTVLSQSLEPEATLRDIASILVPEIADWCRIDLMDKSGVMQRALTYHSDPEKTRVASELVQRLHASPETKGSMAWVARHGEAHLAEFARTEDFDRQRDRDLLTFADAIGLRRLYVVPLIARGRTLGALGALQAESDRPFTESDRALINELAQRAALAIDNARLFADAEAALQEAETANRAKDEFLAMLGHELRNPLAPIVTALHVMTRRGEAGSGEERRIIERQVAHLSRLVDDLLDVSRITKGKIQLERGLVNIKAVVARAIELTQPALDRRSRPIEQHLPEEPVFVAGDSTRLVQVLCNLLTNAVKFTPRDGRLALRVSLEGSDVVIAVEDSGKGIAAELLPRVFDLFVQGGQPLDRRAGGLGLGLSIVKTLVQMHGGTVLAQSDGPGRGSTFVVRLPAFLGASEAISDAPVPEVERRSTGRILIVDDNADAAATLELLLGSEGYEVRTAADANGALSLLDEFIPQVAILDIGLPNMDGYELANRLRQDPRLGTLRIAALTGYGTDRDRERALASSFDEHLVKPIAPARLLEVIDRLVTVPPA